MTEMIKENSIILSVLMALRGEVPPLLREIIVENDNKNILIRAYFDGEISEEDEESMHCVATEVLADFHNTHQVDVEIIRYDEPQLLNALPGAVVYRRREN